MMADAASYEVPRLQRGLEIRFRVNNALGRMIIETETQAIGSAAGPDVNTVHCGAVTMPRSSAFNPELYFLTQQQFSISQCLAPQSCKLRRFKFKGTYAL